MQLDLEELVRSRKGSAHTSWLPWPLLTRATKIRVLMTMSAAQTTTFHTCARILACHEASRTSISSGLLSASGRMRLRHMLLIMMRIQRMMRARLMPRKYAMMAMARYGQLQPAARATARPASQHDRLVVCSRQAGRRRWD